VEVTTSNRLEYFLQYINFRLGRWLPLKELVIGVSHCCSRDYISLFTPQMLQLILSGVAHFTVEQLKQVTKFYGQAESQYPHIVEWYWECVSNMNPDELSLLLAFITGSSNLPVDGISTLNITIYIRPTSSKSLPTSSTCFSLLYLPVYESMIQMKERLLYAIHNVDVTHFGII